MHVTNATQMDEKKTKTNTMKPVYYITMLFMICTISGAQTITSKTVEGRVSYVSTQNIYISFRTTDGIETGDTLMLGSEKGLTPALIVTQKSSISCIAKALEGIKLKVDDMVVANASIKIEAPKVKPVKEKKDKTEISKPKKPTKRKNKERIYGRLALASYSNFSNTSIDNKQRMRYTLSFRGDHIGGSKFSTDNYISFSHRSGEWSRIQDNIFEGLKIYSLALKYDISYSTNIWIGRKINSHVANIGAIDGIQFQTAYKNFTFGIAGGSRPDYSDYSINTNLLQYGGFVAHSFQTKSGNASTSLALFEQTNMHMTDRRFAYFQHSNSLIKNLNIFASCELDLYKLENDRPTNTLDLTGLYVSLRYRPWRKISLSTSYDARRNIIYYESYKNLADRILENETRQGFRFQVLLRPINYLTASLRAGYRYRANDPAPTNNASAYITYSRVPVLNGTVSINATMLNTSYLSGMQYALNLSKDMYNGKLYTRLNFRLIDYNFNNSPMGMFQNIGELSLNYRIYKKLQFTANYEATLEKNNLYNRIYLGLIKRF